MNGCLLDTNVVSELTKQDPHPGVLSFIDTQDEVWLSAIVIYELEMGVQLLPQGRRRDRLRDWLTSIVSDFESRILPIERPEAEWAATFQARVRRDGGTLQLADALIAGTATSKDLPLATRNLRDFQGLGVVTINPWDSP